MRAPLKALQLIYENFYPNWYFHFLSGSRGKYLFNVVIFLSELFLESCLSTYKKTTEIIKNNLYEIINFCFAK